LPDRSYWPNRISLRAALGLGFALAAGVGAGVSGLAEREAGRRDQRDQRAAIATQVAESVRRDLVERRHDVELAAQSLDLLLDKASDDEIRLFLKRVRDRSPGFAFIGLVGPDGRYRITTIPDIDGADVSSRPYWLAGRTDMFVSDAHDATLMAAAAGGKDRIPRLVDIAAPVRSGERLRGVVAAHLAADWARGLAVSAAKGLPAGQQPFSRIALRDCSGATLFSVEGAVNSGAQAAESVADVRAAIEGVGAGSQSHWTVDVFAGAAPEGIGFGLGLALTGLGGALGWLLGGALGARLEKLRNHVFRMRSDAPAPFQPSQIIELDDLGAAIHLVSADHEKNNLRA